MLVGPRVRLENAGHTSSFIDGKNAAIAYDAFYVTAAEHLQLPLATLDKRLTQASGPRCQFITLNS